MRRFKEEMFAVKILLPRGASFPVVVVVVAVVGSTTDYTRFTRHSGDQNWLPVLNDLLAVAPGSHPSPRLPDSSSAVSTQLWLISQDMAQGKVLSGGGKLAFPTGGVYRLYLPGLEEFILPSFPPFLPLPSPLLSSPPSLSLSSPLPLSTCLFKIVRC